ncbi:S8 family serine peptidase [Amycolatopsis anabasis]|uniref:S8 family serine peptidase n=1 Tax=Amycolatopsis anabasis TaxID=1840409 RepID=UPI00131E90B5|nr:S8 family serine peptidase [Amycolatopsis anabasis]
MPVPYGRTLGRSTVLGVAAALVAASVSTSAVAAPATAPPPGAGKQAVTLITGDRVFLEAGRPSGYLRAGPGRDGVGFTTFSARGHNYVVPADAGPLVAKGVLDVRLFDITELLAAGYGDASRNTLPLIVTYSGAAPRALSGHVTRELPSIGGAAVTADKGSATALWAGITQPGPSATTFGAGVRKVWLDGKRKSTLDRSVAQIGAPAAWQAGYTGAGTKVAVLDTGVDQTHPDLADREVAEKNFSEAPDAVDRFGHGTHVASIVAGTGAKSGGKYRGVAHGAKILDGKVLDDNGFGNESGIIAGLQWAAEQGANVANLSLGGGDTPQLDPLEEAVNSLSAKYRTLFVIAAGNSGPGKASVNSPGSADAALTVGAVDRENKIAPFSSRGPRIGDGAVKPDITAPGVGIVAALHSVGTIGEPVEPGYTALSGTSMATPHVAGAAALLAQQHPDLSGQQLKSLLTASATPTPGLTAFDQGSGRVDSAKALGQVLTSEPTSVSLGIQQWPHDDDQAVAKEVTYANPGQEPVTFTLGIDAIGPDGKPAPAGLFAVSPASITVPAGGKATATVTGDTRAAHLDGVYSGTLTATAGEATVRTPLAIDREVESYDLTLNTLDRRGAPTANGFTTLVNVDTGEFLMPRGDNGSAKIRVPKGRYVLQGTVVAAPGTPPAFDVLSYPNLTVDGDVTIDLDARLAKPVQVTPPNKDARLSLGELSFQRNLGDRTFSIGFVLLGGSLTGLASAHLGPDLPPAALTAQVNTQWTAGTEFFGLAWFRYGSLFTGFTRDVGPGDVATVRADFGPIRAERTGYSGAAPSPHLQNSFAWGSLPRVEMPGTRTEYYNGEGADWNRMLFVADDKTFGLDAVVSSPPKTYDPGRTYAESFHRAVFGPVLPVSHATGGWVFRDSDVVVANTPLFGDGGGNSGQSVVDSGYTRLYRDGKLLGESKSAGYGRFEVPGGNAEYRLATEGVRGGFDLSSRVSAVWTFRSGTTNAVTRLPISTIRYFPALDGANTAPSGTPFVVPVAVQEQGSAVTKVPYRLTAEASYDGGQTWTPAAVLGNAQLVLQHPAGATSVSLRAKATDGNGNTVEQTIVNAYRLR